MAKKYHKTRGGINLSSAKKVNYENDTKDNMDPDQGKDK